MLAYEQVSDVKRLLAEGLSHHEVSRRTKVSRGTISLIAHGKYKHQPPERSAERLEGQGDFGRPCSPTRCPTCGGLLVRSPCFLCHVRLSRRSRDGART